MQTSAVESLFFNDRGSLTDAKVQQSYSGMLVIARSCTLLHVKVGYFKSLPLTPTKRRGMPCGMKHYRIAMEVKAYYVDSKGYLR